MSILGDLSKFSQDALVELYVLDATILSAGLFYFHAGVNEFKTNVIWQGQEYTAVPVTMSGFEFDGTKFPRPNIQIANIQGVFSALIKQYGDLVGCKVIRKRTTARYLDAANFTSGNPNANPAEFLPDDVFYITRKTSENRLAIGYELGSSLDLQGVMLPRRQIIANICPFKYKGEECGYIGALPSCSKSVQACKDHFGEYAELSFGGFPGAALVDFR